MLYTNYVQPQTYKVEQRPTTKTSRDACCPHLRLRLGRKIWQSLVPATRSPPRLKIRKQHLPSGLHYETYELFGRVFDYSSMCIIFASGSEGPILDTYFGA